MIIDARERFRAQGEKDRNTESGAKVVPLESPEPETAAPEEKHEFGCFAMPGILG